MSLQYRQATVHDLESLRSFHISNHVEETAHCKGESEIQNQSLICDFPQLYDADRFSKGWYRLAILDGEEERIVGSVGLDPCPNDNTVVWFNTYSVAKEMRGRGVGQCLIDAALDHAKEMPGITTVRLVTLKDHSEGIPVMEAARKKYKLAGFEEYKETEVNFGKMTKIKMVWFEKRIA